MATKVAGTSLRGNIILYLCFTSGINGGVFSELFLSLFNAFYYKEKNVLLFFFQNGSVVF